MWVMGDGSRMNTGLGDKVTDQRWVRVGDSEENAILTIFKGHTM